MEHQYADWRELRHESLNSALVRKGVERLAGQIRDALQRQSEQPEASAAAAPTGGRASVTRRSASRKRAAKKVSRSKSSASAARRSATRRARSSGEAGASRAVVEAESENARAPSGPSPKTEPPTRVVDALHRGDFSTITAAIKAAQPGDRILVRPGLYREGLVIDKTLEIIGDGKRDDVVIEAKGKHVVLFQTTMGRVANLTLRQMDGGDWDAVDITQGRLDLEDCDVTSKSRTCVAVHGGADPRVRRNRIHDGKSAGVYVYENGQGTLEDNDIFGNALTGVEIKEGSNPTLRGNRIHDGKQSGVNVHENGQGTLEDNDIFANAYSGVESKPARIPPCVVTASTTVSKTAFMSTRTARGRWRTTTSSATNVRAF